MQAKRSVMGDRFVTQWVGILLAGWLALGTAWAEPVVHYLTVDGAGNEDGSSWANASSNVQAAVGMPDIDEIRMAGGSYDLNTALAWTAGTNVTVRGGYDAATGDYDPTNQITILRQTTYGERVLEAQDLVDSVLESVTLTGGNVVRYGGGIRSVDSGLLIRDCVISNNTARSTSVSTYPLGGGIYVSEGTVQVLDCRIAGNTTYAAYRDTGRGGGLYVADGGELLAANTVIVSNRVILANHTATFSRGAGASHAAGSRLLLRNCLIYANENLPDDAISSSLAGAGVELFDGGVVENCTIAGNRMYNATETGAGLMVNPGGVVSNTVVYGNWRGVTASDFGGDADNVFYSCAPELTNAANVNITDEPRFVDAAAGDFRLDFNSPCIDTGENAGWMVEAVDLAGNPRIMQGRPDRSETVDRGAYEAEPLPDNGELCGDFSADPVLGINQMEVGFSAFAGGANTNGLIYYWDYQNNGAFDEQGADQRQVSHTYGPGTYSVRLVITNELSEEVEIVKTDLIRVSSSIVYVSLEGDNSTGADWDGAFTDVQTAIDQAGVTNIHIAGGVYDLTSQLNWLGHAGVSIRGGYEGISGDPGAYDPEQWPTILRQTTYGERVLEAQDLVDSVLESVTLTGGYVVRYGGGIRSVDSGLLIRDCVISNNTARSTSVSKYPLGGGIYVSEGTVQVLDCRIAGNTTHANYRDTGRGGGLYVADGGELLAANTVIVSNRVILANHTATFSRGAGASHAAGSRLLLRNCLIYANENLPDAYISSSLAGAGVELFDGGVVENCTIAGNRMYNEADTGAGLYLNGGTVTNTIVWGNWRGGATNDVGFGSSASEAGNVFYSCAPELTLATAPNHNLADDPLFLDVAAGDFRLQHDSPHGSPAINAGINQPWMLDATDLAGLPRILMGNVDMGCYEIPPPGGTLFLVR